MLQPNPYRITVLNTAVCLCVKQVVIPNFLKCTGEILEWPAPYLFTLFLPRTNTLSIAPHLITGYGQG